MMTKVLKSVLRKKKEGNDTNDKDDDDNDKSVKDLVEKLLDILDDDGEKLNDSTRLKKSRTPNFSSQMTRKTPVKIPALT